MDRRTFVASSGSLCLAGCLGGDDEESDDQAEADPETDRLRELTVTGDNLRVEREGLVTENDAVFVSLSVKNTAQSHRSADISLQMRDETGESVGPVYNQTAGPIEPQETVTVQIDLEEEPGQVGGYRLDVTERER